MAKGNEIIVNPSPRGRFIEGIVNGTPSPGTVMQLDAAVEPVNGAYTWEPYSPDADGDQRLIAVLLPDHNQGKIATSAYVTATRCFMYVPLPGDELNMLVAAAGTSASDAQAIGDILMVNNGDGLLIATTGTPESEPFVCMETVTDVTATGTLVHCMYTGH